jgi:hypothetical protein
VTDRVVLKWPVAVDDRVHRIGGGQIVHVACQDPREIDCVMVWTIEPRPARGESPVPTREVQVFGTGQPLPFFADHLGTAITANGQLVWHLFALPPVLDGTPAVHALTKSEETE